MNSCLPTPRLTLLILLQPWSILNTSHCCVAPNFEEICCHHCVARWQTAHSGSFDSRVVAVTASLLVFRNRDWGISTSDGSDNCVECKTRRWRLVSMCTAVTDVGELHNYLFCVSLVRLASSCKQGDYGVLTGCAVVISIVSSPHETVSGYSVWNSSVQPFIPACSIIYSVFEYSPNEEGAI